MDEEGWPAELSKAERYKGPCIIEELLLDVLRNKPFQITSHAWYAWIFHGMQRRRPHLIRWIFSIQIWMDEPQCWEVRLLSEEPPLWLGILAKSSLVSVCKERACVRCRLHDFEFFSPYLHSWTLSWWSERQLDSLCVFEERIRAIISVLLSSFSVEMCCSCVTLLCFQCCLLVVVGTQAVVTHDRYLHDRFVL